MVIQTTVNPNFNGDFEVIIRRVVNNEIELQYPIVEDGVKWETENQGSPAKLTFKLYKDKNGALNFQEGDEVILRYHDSVLGWSIVFHGYIFTKKRSKDDWIDVTAYDALRYLKNKATYTYTNKTASEVVKMICEDYKLPVGVIEDTKYVISERIEENQTLLDIIQNALDLTLISTIEKYILYTEDGKICLKNAKNLISTVVINKNVAEDFDYSSSIDGETYNEIELYYDNDTTKKREYYHAYDELTMKKWGRLRLTEEVKDKTNVRNRAEQMLKLYNQRQRELKVKEAFGDISCRGGASAIVNLELGDIIVSNYMIIEKATHTFKNNQYRMDLTLVGFPQEETGETTYSEANVAPSSSYSSSSSSSSFSSSIVDLSKSKAKQDAKSSGTTTNSKEYDTITIKIGNYDSEYASNIEILYCNRYGKNVTYRISNGTQHFQIQKNSHSKVQINISSKVGRSHQLFGDTSSSFNKVQSLPQVPPESTLPNGNYTAYRVKSGASGNLTFSVMWVHYE